MNSPDPFEERLARTPFRPAPADLRRQVLQAAPSSSGNAGQSAPVRSWLTGWISPRPLAWGALAFAWLVILLLNLAAFHASGGTPQPHALPRASAAMIAQLREQRALLESLLRDMPMSPPATPGPDAQFRPRKPSHDLAGTIPSARQKVPNACCFQLA